MADDLTPLRDARSDNGVERNFDSEVNDHRNRSMYIGLRLPRIHRRPGRDGRRNDDHRPLLEDYSPTTGLPKMLSPGDHIRYLLSDGDDEDITCNRRIFCQMDTLNLATGELYWKETGRWVKYEETVESGGERWSKPYVASLSLHSLMEMRSCITSGCVMFDVEAMHITQVIGGFLENIINTGQLDASDKQSMATILLAPHRYQHVKRRRSSIKPEDKSRLTGVKSMHDFGKVTSNRHVSEMDTLTVNEKMIRNQSLPTLEEGDIHESVSLQKLNQNFMRKIPEGAEAANIFVGEIPCLEQTVMGFIRLNEGRVIGDITEVPIPTRFVVFLLGPPGSQARLVEMGRCIATILVDEVFREVAYRARDKKDILAGIDEFLDQVTVLPPAEWDPEIRLEPPEKVPSQEKRIQAPLEVEIELDHLEGHCDPTLVKSGRPFGGLIDDIRRKLPWYWSDIKDVLHMQSIASVIFIFLATLTPNVTFGGLLNEATHGYMGAMECILAAAVTGVLFALFSGQPLNILGSTGPMLVLEMIIYNFCQDYKLDFMPFRLWVGIWTAAILFIIVMFDLSFLVRYITRFTEESFACLIAIIFLVEAVKKLVKIANTHPIDGNPDVRWALNCTCMNPANDSMFNASSSMLNSSLVNVFNATTDFSNFSYKECVANKGVPADKNCWHFPDVFLLSVIEFIGTVWLALVLKGFRNSTFFPTIVRQTIHDFAVLISIVVFVVLDILIAVPTPKLTVPDKFEPTRPGRPWIISPVSDRNPWWLTLAAAIPATLATILVFMDQQITAVIVNRKENKLKKGSGYHLDLLVVAICILICSFFGLPWYVAATVSAIAHIMSLKKESECNAPGEKPVFLGVREQRVTAFLVGVLSGCSILLTGILKIIPMPVLYGVFFYMGVAALIGMQLVDRIMIIFMPQKYQPDLAYLRHVRLLRVHMFTGIQILCLASLWVIKTIKVTSIVFPLLVVGTCFVRISMNFFFTQYELKWLDDIMPEATIRAKDDKKREKEADVTSNLLEKPLVYEMKNMSGHRNSITSGNLNISDELSKTVIWNQLRQNDTSPRTIARNNNHVKSRKLSKNEDDKEISFFISEDDDHKMANIPEEEEKKVILQSGKNMDARRKWFES